MATSLDLPAYDQTSSKEKRRPLDEHFKLTLRSRPDDSRGDLDLPPIPEPPLESRSAPRVPVAPAPVNPVQPAPAQPSGASTAERLMQQQLEAAQPAMDEKVRKSKGQSAADFYRKSLFDTGFFKTAEERAAIERSRLPLPVRRPAPAAAPGATHVGNAGVQTGNTITSPYGTASVTVPQARQPVPLLPPVPATVATPAPPTAAAAVLERLIPAIQDRFSSRHHSIWRNPLSSPGGSGAL